MWIPEQPDSYPAAFSLARSLHRQVHFHLGPTNSGKTHEALQHLQAASSGVYLAPLRLLAMEVRDRLLDAGVPCNLITGEERQILPSARHTACTIEMMQSTQVVDVAVIDEIQMLQDPSRGHAWTAALVGVPAAVVHVCGAASVHGLCENLLTHLGEHTTTTYLQRKTPLRVEAEALCGTRYNRRTLKGKIQAGDAIIAFSRKDVLTLSARVRQWGFTVATIYGALSPEVRRTESRRFNTGEAQVLVATDAIGMGLNLPIRRVVFSATSKFDGVAARELNATEVRQIAGRAGRFGIYPEGYVNAMEQSELELIQHLLETSDQSELQKLPIAPGFSHMHDLSSQLHSGKLAELLQYFSDRMGRPGALFSVAPLDTQIAIAALVDRYAPALPLAQKFSLSCAPVSLDKPPERDYFLHCVAAIAQKNPVSLPSEIRWLAGDTPKHLEDAEQLSQNLSLYAWLSFKFPRIFIDRDSLPALHGKVSRYIERALLIQAGYPATSRELGIWHERW